MARKSNKTAHVLGLITNEKNDDNTEDDAVVTPKAVKKAVVRRGPAASIGNDADIQNKLSNAIHEKLLEELDGPPPLTLENSAAANQDIPVEDEPVENEPLVSDYPLEDFDAPNVQPEPVQPTIVQPEPVQPTIVQPEPVQATIVQPEPVQPTIVQPEPVQATIVQPEPVQATIVQPEPEQIYTQPIDTPTPNTPAAETFAPESPYTPPAHADYIYINVLEELVKDRIIERMNDLDLCLCNRCVMDTMALALTRLPSKYIVVEKGQGIPLLNYYGTRYQIQVVSELTKACMVIKSHPHH